MKELPSRYFSFYFSPRKSGLRVIGQGAGFRAGWKHAEFGADSLHMKNASGFPDASGTPFGGAVGIDYLTTAGLVLGMAFGDGYTVQDFSSGGHFNQDDEVLSLYAAYKNS